MFLQKIFSKNAVVFKPVTTAIVPYTKKKTDLAIYEKKAVLQNSDFTSPAQAQRKIISVVQMHYQKK